MELDIIILGAGESGVGAACLAKQKGYKVFVSEKNIINSKFKKILRKNKIAFEEGKHSANKVLNANEIIKSPGIPNESILIQKIKKNKKNINIKFVNSPIMNQLSYHTDKNKLSKEGLVLNSNLNKEIEKTLKLFMGIN